MFRCGCCLFVKIYFEFVCDISSICRWEYIIFFFHFSHMCSYILNTFGKFQFLLRKLPLHKVLRTFACVHKVFCQIARRKNSSFVDVIAMFNQNVNVVVSKCHVNSCSAYSQCGIVFTTFDIDIQHLFSLSTCTCSIFTKIG